MAMPEDAMQECLELGELGGTPSEAAAVRRAFDLGRLHMLAEVLSELDGMSASMSAFDAAVDFRQTWETELKATRKGPVEEREVWDDTPEQAASRQARRAEARAASKRNAALTKMAENAERVVLGEETASKMQRMRMMLFAIVHQLGRVRLTQQELNAVLPKDGLDVKVQPHGDLVVTYLRARDR